MGGVIDGFVTIAIVILVGWLLAHLRVLDLAAQRVLAEIAFPVGSPALLITVLADADLRELFSRNLIATITGVVVPVAVFVAAARMIWRLPLSETVIGSLSSAR